MDVWCHHERTLAPLFMLTDDVRSGKYTIQEYQLLILASEECKEYLHISFTDSFASGREYKVGKEDEQETLHFDNGEAHSDACLSKVVRL